MNTTSTTAYTVCNTACTTAPRPTTTTQLEWCNLNQYEEITIRRLSTSKTIAMISLDKYVLYDEAKDACESICGSLYFPSTLPENRELKSVFNDVCNHGYHICSRGTWIRLRYNETEKKWKDPDGKENLTFKNFHRHDEIRNCTDSTKQHYAPHSMR